MVNAVKIIECPRDAWQGLPLHIPAEVKADYLRLLIAAGFRHIDAVSFVSAAAVPQMTDSEKVLDYLDAPGSGSNSEIEIIGIVVNAKGAERAIKTDAVQTLGFPYSISPEFLKRNQNQTPEESLEALEQVGTLAYKAGLDVAAYISMAFGNPYGDPWSIDEVVDACDLLVDSGVTQISLADTVGMATPKLIADVVSDVMAVHDQIEIGVHLHGRYENTRELVRAAYNAGCRRFDAAIGGLGGCPFAQDVLLGNLPTEMVLEELRALGAELPQLGPLESLQSASAEIARKYGARVQ
ncbi:hydroxymethylglutaryl-CoA lyase [Edaphobacter sp. 12200R-103]|uniref:hydroxymethylglutaryl-CoA lyase n=1 Tax=Edaphobacter sp. 12200R-103 TaxID=2703788 RepID=UPI00138D8287|nr:hydroxymethylglutaryl-CoA lyase [Edaphobacter sp. 12200R-103]QHS50362.1 hydroxymethylglutaryl-CoA lyase [Edaphobacter sp. 12200R-103]